MNGPRCALLILGALLSAAFVPTATAADPVLPLAADDCAPPCGSIWPTIGMEPDVAFPYPTSKLDVFPAEIHITVTYKWDMEQDGTGPPGDTEPMTITFALNKKPVWMDAKLDPAMCEFMLNPAIAEYEVCTLTLTTKVLSYPMSEFDYEQAGKRLMVFAASRQSGIFQPSYGVEDMRFTWDGLPAGVQVPSTETNESNALGFAPFAAVVLVAAALRRRL